MNKDREARRNAYKAYCEERIPEDSSNAQNVFTPYELCYDIIRKLDSKTRNLAKKEFLVFNLEFAEVLIHDFGVSPERIAFWTDCDGKRKFAEHIYKGIQHHKIELNKESVETMTKNAKEIKEKDKFDVVIGNPPYQAPKKIDGPKKGTIGGNLWSKFVEMSLELAKRNGYVCLVHPPAWRKPEHNLFGLIKEKNLCYVEIHGEKDGRLTFGVSTNYDWYVLQNASYNGKTVIKDEKGDIHKINIMDYSFIPSSSFGLLNSIIAKDDEEICEVLYDTSCHTQINEYMNVKQTNKFKYPCVHSMRKNGELIYWYSNKKNGFFDVPKVILNFGRHLYPYVDFEGKYGLTQIAFGLKISSKKEGNNIKKAIESDKFKELVKATKWSSFQTDWRMFKYLKKDFWKEFV